MHKGYVIVTGVTGFVGQFLATRLLADGYHVRGVARRVVGLPHQSVELINVGAVDGFTRWGDALVGADTVIHLAARTHAVEDRGGGNLADYRPVNVDGTRRLGEAAARCGVRRIVFVSSIKVNGNMTSKRPFVVEDRPRPEDAYGVSKWEAEQVLGKIAAESGLESVVIRPPLVYGLGAKGNFARLCNAIRHGTLLPFGSVNNRRSLVAVDNLVDLIVNCVSNPAASGQTFLVSDGEDLSTPELVRRIAQAMGTKARLIPVPQALLRIAAGLTGWAAELDRLLGSLQVDMEHTCQTLDWTPPVNVATGLQRAVADA